MLGVGCSRAVPRDTGRSRVAPDLFAGLVVLVSGRSSLARLARSRSDYDALSLALWLLLAERLALVVGRRLDGDS